MSETIENALLADKERRRAAYEHTSVAERKALLTQRELEVMEHVIAGKRSKEIAAELGISIGTVETHRARIMKKMQADTIADLVRMSISNS